MNRAAAKFAARFQGKANAGIRHLIRLTAINHAGSCGTEISRAILSLSGVVALTSSGLVILEAVAVDFCESRPMRSATCDCGACTHMLAERGLIA